MPDLFNGYCSLQELYHERSDKCEDGIELWESGVDHCVCLNVVTL